MEVLLVVFTLLLLLRASKVLFGSYFAPLGVYGSVWLGALLLFHLPVFNYRTLSSLTVGVIWLSFGTFTCGALTIGLAARLGRRQCKVNVVRKPAAVVNRKLLEYAIVILSILGVVGAMGLLVRVASVYGLAGLFHEASRIRAEVAVFGENIKVGKGTIYALGLIYVAGSLSGFYLGYFRRRFLFAYLPVVSIIVFEIAFLGRAEVLIFSLLFSICYIAGMRVVRLHGSRAKVRPVMTAREIIALAVAVVIVFVAVNALLHKGVSERQFARVHLPASLLNIYAYIATPIAALDVALSRPMDHYLLGQATFYPAARALYRIGLIRNIANTSYVLDTVRTPVPSNTFTYLRPLYEDFGLIGIAFLPWLIGVLSSYLFMLYKRRPNLIKIVTMAYIYVFLVFSIQGNQFWSITFTFAFVVASLIAAAVSYLPAVRRSRKIAATVSIDLALGDRR